MSNPKSSATTSTDWTRLLTDPDLISHLGKLLQTYREAPPDKREQALLAAMRDIKSGVPHKAAAAAGAGSSAHSVPMGPEAESVQLMAYGRYAQPGLWAPRVASNE